MKNLGVTGLVVSVNYADFLAVTLPKNNKVFSRMLVVTSERDRETIEVCRKHHVPFVTTEAFWKNGAPFNKAAGLNRGLQAIKSDYVCKIDADILVPEDMLAHFDSLDERCLYGMNRNVYETLGDVATGKGEDRFMPTDYITGFFQLFNKKSPYFPGRFSEAYPTAAHYDIEFMLHWPSRMRRRLIEAPVVHIGKRGQNWFGRRGSGPNGEAYLQPQLKSSRDDETSFRLTYLPSSQTLLVTNLTASVMDHVRLHLHGRVSSTRHRFRTLLPGSYIELQMSRRVATSLRRATVEAVRQDGRSLTLELPIHVVGSPVKREH